jgi:uncharacterized protein (TIGR03067 family)
MSRSSAPSALIGKQFVDLPEGSSLTTFAGHAILAQDRRTRFHGERINPFCKGALSMGKLAVTAVWLVCSSLLVAARAAADDRAALAGTWATTRMATAGKELPPAQINSNVTVTFEGDKMITKRRGKIVATWTYKLDETTSPKRMTINTAAEGAKERWSLLIYKIEGDTLTTVAGSRKFPAEFTINTEQGCYFTVRQRVKE